MIKLSKRLNACASLVQSGTRLCDVGTDHGYVPVSLVLCEKIKSAVACDINKGPLNSCISLVNEYDLGDRIKCLLSNGLEKVNGNEIDDVLIAGMGGELIVDILSSCDYIRDKHLILNPMTHPEVTRKWLYSNGFDIVNDIIVQDGRYYYAVFDACYTGKVYGKSECDYYLGNIQDFSCKEYFLHLLNYLRNKEKGGENHTEIIKKIEEIV